MTHKVITPLACTVFIKILSTCRGKKKRSSYLTCTVSFVWAIPAVIMSVTDPALENTRARIITFDQLRSRQICEVTAVCGVTSHLVWGVRTVLVKITAVARHDTGAVTLTAKLPVSTAASFLIRVIFTVVLPVTLLVSRNTPLVGAVEIPRTADTWILMGKTLF